MSDASRIVLGSVQWGLPYGIANRSGQPGSDQVSRILGEARLAGVDLIDTARAYGNSESVIGALTEREPHWKIVTKVTPQLDLGGGSRAQVGEAVERSLSESHRALRRDRLELVLLHRAEQRCLWGGVAWDVLRRHRDAGRVTGIGVSVGSPEEAYQALEDGEVDALQVAGSLLDQRLARGGFFERAAMLRKQVFVRSVFLQGVAFLDPMRMPGFLEPAREVLVAVRGWAERHGCDLGDVFLLYARQRLQGRLVLGCETSEQLAANLATWRRQDIEDHRFDELAALVPDLGDEILNPALWPKR